MIGKNVVLTSAENLYNNVKKKKMKKIEFALDVNGKKRDVFKVRKVFYPD